MIVLHPSLTDDLVIFEDYESICARPAFSLDVVPGPAVRLVKPVGVYRFRNKIACGLKDCHQPHQKGLVVLTSDGRETNIGHRCGTSHFEESFAVFSNMAQRFHARRSQIEALRTYKATAGRLIAQVEALLAEPKGARWISAAVSALAARVPGDAMQALSELARRGEAEVFEDIEVRGEDAGLTRQFGVRNSWERSREDLAIRRESRGRIVGAEIFHRDAASVLTLLSIEMRQAASLDPFACSRSVLREATQFVSEAESRIRAAALLVEAGRAFFTKENVARLQYIPRLFQGTRRALASLKWDSEKGCFSKRAA